MESNTLWMDEKTRTIYSNFQEAEAERGASDVWLWYLNEQVDTKHMLDI